MESMTQPTDDIGGNALWIVLLVLLPLLVLSLMGCSTTEVGEVEQVSDVRFRVVEADNDAYWTATDIIVDTKTGCQYLWVKESEKAGLELLVDANGEPLIAKGEQ